jgi:Protein of unknown function (DUF551)
MSEWQPIETAPNGEPILLGFPRKLHSVVGHMEDGVWGEFAASFDFLVFPVQPTHWMPLPEPPCG